MFELRPLGMAILYSVIARGQTVLAKYASCAGNFQEVAEQILAKIPSDDAKLTYSHGNFLFHYVCEDRIVYMAITEDDFERSRAFRYLSDIKKRFKSTYGNNVHTALPYAMDTEFSGQLMIQMRHYSKDEPEELNKVGQVQDQLDELKGIMVQNIDSIATRGENLNLLVDKTEDLSESAVTFKKQSTTLARKMWWKKVKWIILLSLLGILIFYFIMSAACGGLNWPRCVHHGNGTKVP
uniref:Vesicle-associated membrane protein 7 n=1 Tax=Phallusia mammillata TaxID=59560 RepID=A0A6F9DVZ6_9ASCI|nr:vesicle-associated membrane protein 7-like [Phallusia mammillata]